MKAENMKVRSIANATDHAIVTSDLDKAEQFQLQVQLFCVEIFML